MLLAVVMFLSAVQFITLCGKMCTDTKMLVKIISDEKLRAHDDRVNGVKAIQEQLSRQYGVSLGHMRDLARLMRIRSPYPVELRVAQLKDILILQSYVKSYIGMCNGSWMIILTYCRRVK